MHDFFFLIRDSNMTSSLSLVQPSYLQDVGRGALARSALIKAAVEVFGANSIESATTRDIAQRAGQNVSSIAYYFGSKEGLYLAVAEHIAEILNARIGPLLNEISEFLQSPKPSGSQCLDYFGRLLLLAVASNRDMLSVTNIIIKEQMHPTEAFTILYDRALGRLQKAGAQLIDAYTGTKPGSEETIVRFHALLGQSLAFRMARETIIRRAGWTDIGEREEKLVEKIVVEQACDVLRSLRKRRGRKEVG
jgi:AcrR family transcriptional regulator